MSKKNSGVEMFCPGCQERIFVDDDEEFTTCKKCGTKILPVFYEIKEIEIDHPVKRMIIQAGILSAAILLLAVCNIFMNWWR